MRQSLLFTLIILSAGALPAREPRRMQFDHLHDLPSTCREITMTMRADASGRPFLYVASKEGGLKVYSMDGVPRLVAGVPLNRLQGLHVTNLHQSGSVLFLSLGNFFAANKQAPGMAVIDVSEPASPEVLALWLDPGRKGGAAAVLVDGDTAYLAAMGSGVAVLDVSNKRAPREVGALVPALDFPDQRYDSRKINARGLALAGSTLFVCYDAGGLRAVDVSDPAEPREIGRYANPVLNRKPRAYNNIVIDGETAYVAVDYCGIEVLDVSNPSAMRQVAWWNPWECEKGALKWFGSPGHTNELSLDGEREMLYISAGKSDLLALDVSNPASPRLAGEYGGTENGIGTWGVSHQDGRVFLAYVCTLGIPFRSNWSGIKVLQARPSP